MFQALLSLRVQLHKVLVFRFISADWLLKQNNHETHEGGAAHVLFCTVMDSSHRSVSCMTRTRGGWGGGEEVLGNEKNESSAQNRRRKAKLINDV